MTGAAEAPPARYLALALQAATASLPATADHAEARAHRLGRVAALSRQLQASCAFLRHANGTPPRLAVLPEYSLTGAPAAGEFTRWRALGAIAADGPEIEALGRAAGDSGVWLAANAYEADANFPDLYFQTCFLLDPDGRLALRYRRLVSLYSPSPVDVLDRYVGLYGAEALFPVADTPIGRVAAIASEEILYPEIARCLALRGAEVFVHSTSEMGSPAPTAKDIARRARAAENLAFVVSANAAAVTGTALPDRSSTGMSKILDWEGRVLASAAPGGETFAAHATLDLGALRARRRQPGLSNVLVRQPLAAYAAAYSKPVFQPENSLAGVASPSTEHLRARQQEVIERLARLGVI